MTSSRKAELNSALADAVREFGSPTTPQELESRGLRKVRYVPVRKISEMIEKAINRTILERTLGATNGDGDLAALVDHAQAGMLGLLKGVEDVVASQGALTKSREELLEELAEMRRERAQPTPMLAADPSDPTVQKMVAAIRETFAKLGPRTPDVVNVEHEFTERAKVLLEEARRRAAAAQIRERDAHVDRLDRRIKKLLQSLEETEAALKQIAAMKNIDLGIASLYKVVQGLPMEEANRALKQELMTVIFRANVDLQKRLQEKA
jgi:hypothetical protein